jgi:hypothetical protein
MGNALDAVLAQYEKNTSPKGGGDGMSQEERLKKYYTTYLPKGAKSGQSRIRILPTPDGSSPFKEVWFHEIQIDGKWTKIYDPGKNDGERSPLTEVYEALMSTGKESDKKLATQYKPRKYYIVKVVDRDNEDDGVKFWRFKDNYKKEGILDKIIPIWRSKGDITNPEEGRDLIIELTKSKTNSGVEYTVVQTIMYDDPSPLSEDKNKTKEWVEDEMTWSDVYAQRPIEYLEAIARGETPVWDSELKKFVYGDDTTEVIGGKSDKKPSKKVVKDDDDDDEDDDPQGGMEVDEDLPF